jgi:hypothetical protein
MARSQARSVSCGDVRGRRFGRSLTRWLCSYLVETRRRRLLPFIAPWWALTRARPSAPSRRGA